MTRAISLLLEEILEAISLIQQYLENTGFEDFVRNREKQDAPEPLSPSHVTPA